MLAVGAVEQARAAAQEHPDDMDLHLVETESLGTIRRARIVS
jgi:hypothetical protein